MRPNAAINNRAAIEEDYARRLAKLARMPLGKDETGYAWLSCRDFVAFSLTMRCNTGYSDFSNVLRRVQYELDQSGRCHNELAKCVA